MNTGRRPVKRDSLNRRTDRVKKREARRMETLFFEESLDFAEIASLMGRDVRTVKARLARHLPRADELSSPGISRVPKILPLERLKGLYRLGQSISTAMIGDCVLCQKGPHRGQHEYTVREDTYQGREGKEPVQVLIDLFPDGHYEAAVKKAGKTVAQYRAEPAKI